MRGEKDICILVSPDYHDADEHLLKCSHVSVSGRSQISENIPPLKVHYAHCSQSPSRWLREGCRHKTEH